jgi:hypothetical protein
MHRSFATSRSSIQFVNAANGRIDGLRRTIEASDRTAAKGRKRRLRESCGFQTFAAVLGLHLMTTKAAVASPIRPQMNFVLLQRSSPKAALRKRCFSF